MFQSTHPRGVRLSASWRQSTSRPFQSTHPRGVRRLLVRMRYFQRHGFNPRTRVGCDKEGVKRALAAVEVSIHAPAWGATYRSDLFAAYGMVSIHAPAWGATTASCALTLAVWMFQSTHPRGVRPSLSYPICSSVNGFNPRTRVGCDHHRFCTVRGPGRVSIHAPAWGATRAGKNSAPARRRFQSTHPRGVRHGRSREATARMMVSIHAPAWGATRSSSGCIRSDCCFNPRTRVGCDQLVPSMRSGLSMFQSTHPRGVRLFPCFIQ